MLTMACTTVPPLDRPLKLLPFSVVRELARILDPSGLWRVVAGEFHLGADEARTVQLQDMSPDGSATCSLLTKLSEHKGAFINVGQLLEVLQRFPQLLRACTVLRNYATSPVAGRCLRSWKLPVVTNCN